MDERHAIRLCLQHRDPAGFEHLVRQYRKEAFHHAYALLGNADDAADACQESFLKAFVAMPQLKELTGFYPWFYRILRNSCLNMLGRRRSANRYQISQRQRGGNEDSRGTTDPSALLERKEEAERVWNILLGLRTDHREILGMKYIQELSYLEISTLLNIPRGTVMSRLYLARKSFREAMMRSQESGAAGKTEKEPIS